jgi:hypothetical protein
MSFVQIVRAVRVVRIVRVVLVLVCVPHAADANPESARLRARAYEYALNLDYDEATRQMEAAVKADPNDPSAERGLAAIPWTLISFRRGTVTVDDYLGGVTRQNVALKDPPADLATRFNTHIQRATMLAEALLRAKPRDANAHYQVGAAIGLQASYIATVEGASSAPSAPRAVRTMSAKRCSSSTRRARTPGSSSVCIAMS